MIKTLQKKFVITAMIAVTVLMLLMLGAINIGNMVIVSGQVNRTLLMISKNEGNVGNLRPERKDMSQKEFPEADFGGPKLGGPKNDYDTFMSSNFFVVRFNTEGDIVYTDVSRTSTISESEAGELAEAVYNGEKTKGKSGKFRYLKSETRIMDETSIVFLDTSNEIFSYLRVLLLSAAIGIMCWGLMLIFVILLSRRAIRPIAENIERQKQFVTNAGHEIKTPLAIIQSNTEAMELYGGENKWSRNIKEQTVRLDGLMKKLLLLSRMEESAGQGNPSDFSFSGLLSDMTQDFAPMMEKKNIVFTAGIQPDIFLHADKGHMEQLVSILLDNAVKYAKEGGEIKIALKKSEKEVKLQVQNTCESLPKVAPEKLFDRFYRGDSARTQKSGGYGIGLSMARSIAETNKCSIACEYAKPDWVRFIVIF